MTSGQTHQYASLTTANRSRLKRFSHGRRHRIALSLVPAVRGDRVLDVGTGDAHFPRLLVAERPGVSVVGYDPIATMLDLARAACAGIAGITLRATLEPGGVRYQWVTCFETLEHLTPDAQLQLLVVMRNAVTPAGRVVVSVPLEIGLPGLAKNLARGVLRQSHRGTWRAFYRAAIGLPSTRTFDADGYAGSHVGFSHRPLRRLLLDAGFAIERTVYSPLPALRWLANSQVFWILRPVDRAP